MATAAQVKSLRSDYSKAKSAYHKAGKAAFGKPANSTAKKEYKTARNAYKKAGALLGKATGRKSKSGRK